MRQSYESRQADRALDDMAAEKHLMCQAHECPNRWTVDRGSRLCSAHAWAAPEDWAAVTQKMIDLLVTPRVAEKNAPAPVSDAQKGEILARLRRRNETKSFKAWAYALQRRHEAGEPLSKQQIDSYRTALRLNLKDHDD